jgi:hypothetical protein
MRAVSGGSSATRTGRTRTRRLILDAEASDAARALPDLASAVPKPFRRGRDSSAIVVRFDPLAGRDLSHAIEAIKPV